jgi:hypothetical protein
VLSLGLGAATSLCCAGADKVALELGKAGERGQHRGAKRARFGARVPHTRGFHYFHISIILAATLIFVRDCRCEAKSCSPRLGVRRSKKFRIPSGMKRLRIANT